MSGPWEDYASSGDTSAPWDDYAPAAKPKAMGQAANADFLRAELRNADPFTRNLAGAGVALSDTWEGLKQWFGKGDKEQIANNKIIADEAPIGHIAGEAAMLLGPLGVAGASVKGAAKVGAVAGALRPAEGDGADEVLANKAKNILLDTAMSATGQKVANVGGEWIAKMAADLGLKKSMNATRDATLQDALDKGLTVTPSAVNPSLANTTKESFGGKIATAQAASEKNEARIPALIREELHLPPDAPLTGETLQAARDKAYAVGYKPVADLPAVNLDNAFVDDLKNLIPANAGGAIKSPGHAEINDLVDSLASRGQWTGEQLLQDIRQLRENATARFSGAASSGERDLARAERKAANALEGLADRNINLQGGDPNAMALYREARQYIAKTHDVEKALIEGSGGVDARKFGAMYQKNPDRLTGNLATIGAFANNFKSSVQPGAKVQGPGVSALTPWLGAVGGGYAGGDNPGTGAAMGTALAMLGRPAIRAQMLSRRSQNKLLDMYRLGTPTVAANRLLQYAPVGLTVAGREALP